MSFGLVLRQRHKLEGRQLYLEQLLVYCLWNCKVLLGWLGWQCKWDESSTFSCIMKPFAEQKGVVICLQSNFGERLEFSR